MRDMTRTHNKRVAGPDYVQRNLTDVRDMGVMEQ
jgi:hypothetical protein